MAPPQQYIPPAANVLATIGTVLWCIQLVPQVWHNWKRKSSEGLPGSMMFLWAVCSIPFGVYAIIQNFAIGIQVQPQCFGVLALICWGQVLYYGRSWSRTWSIVAVVGMCTLFGLLEVLFVFTLRIPYGKGDDRPVLAMGIMATILLAAGLVPPYYEIWKRGGRVVGINWLFLATDWTGGLLSLLAVVFQQTWDALGGTLYVVVIGLETGIFVSHGVWLLRQKIRKRKSGSGEGEEEQIENEGQREKELDEEKAIETHAKREKEAAAAAAAAGGGREV